MKTQSTAIQPLLSMRIIAEAAMIPRGKPRSFERAINRCLFF